MTKKLPRDRIKKPPSSAAERQKKYRIKNRLITIDICPDTASSLEDLRSRLKATNNAIISQALAVLGSKLTEASAILENGKPFVSNRPAAAVVRHTLTDQQSPARSAKGHLKATKKGPKKKKDERQHELF